MKVLYGMSKETNVKPTLVDFRAEAKKEAEKRELKFLTWGSTHGFKKLLFGRWLMVFCDMKGFKS